MFAASSTTTTGVNACRTRVQVSANPGCSGRSATSATGTQRSSTLSAFGVASSSRAASASTVWNAQPPWSSTYTPNTRSPSSFSAASSRASRNAPLIASSWLSVAPPGSPHVPP